MIKFLLNIFKIKLNAADLNNKRRSGNAKYDDVCM